MLYDTILLFGLLLLLWIGFYFLMVGLTGHEDIGHEPLAKLYWPLAMLCLVGFFVWFWTHGGQTLGMRSWRIRLLGEDGEAVTARQAVTRCALAVVSALPLGLGYWWALIDRDRRTWHDMLSHTQLVLLEKA